MSPAPQHPHLPYGCHSVGAGLDLFSQRSWAPGWAFAFAASPLPCSWSSAGSQAWGGGPPGEWGVETWGGPESPPCTPGWASGGLGGWAEAGVRWLEARWVMGWLAQTRTRCPPAWGAGDAAGSPAEGVIHHQASRGLVSPSGECCPPWEWPWSGRAGGSSEVLTLPPWAGGGFCPEGMSQPFPFLQMDLPRGSPRTSQLLALGGGIAPGQPVGFLAEDLGMCLVPWACPLRVGGGPPRRRCCAPRQQGQTSCWSAQHRPVLSPEPLPACDQLAHRPACLSALPSLRPGQESSELCSGRPSLGTGSAGRSL